MSRKMTQRLVWLLLVLPAFYLGWRISTHDLGAQPAKTLLTSLGTLCVRLFLLNLYIGIGVALLRPFPKNLIWMIAARRPLGIMTFVYLIFHFAFYFINEATFEPAFLQIFEKQYLIVAFIAWILLFLLALTSNDVSVQKLKPRRWKKLHRMAHVATLLIFLHIIWIEKADIVLALVYFIPIFILQSVRLVRFAYRKSMPTSLD